MTRVFLVSDQSPSANQLQMHDLFGTANPYFLLNSVDFAPSISLNPTKCGDDCAKVMLVALTVPNRPVHPRNHHVKRNYRDDMFNRDQSCADEGVGCQTKLGRKRMATGV